MQDEDARSKRELSSARAKLAMRGVKEGSTAWNETLKNTQAVLDKDKGAVTGGYTAKELKDQFGGYLSGIASKYGGRGGYGYYEKTVAPEIEKAGGMDKYIESLQADYDSLTESVDQYNKMDWEDQQQNWSGMSNKFKQQGIRSQIYTLKTARAGIQALQAQGYENPEVWEGFYAGRYGVQKFAPAGPTKEEQSMEQAKAAGGGQAAFQMGAAPEGTAASPWMSADEKEKSSTASPNI